MSTSAALGKAKKKLKNINLVVEPKRWFVVFTLVLLLTLRFLPELHFLAWHAIHGNRATVGNYEVPIPIFSFGDHWGKSYAVLSISGRAHGWLIDCPTSVNSISYQSPAEYSATEKQKISAEFAKLGVTTATSELVVAGARMKCFEEADRESAGQVTISCVPENKMNSLQIVYMGAADGKLRFYQQVQQIRKKS